MKKVLIIETNVNRYKGTDEATGLWLGESAEFIDEFQKCNIDYDVISPKGGLVPLDPRSMKYIDSSIWNIYESSDFADRAIRNTMRPEDINPKDYVAIYFTGGHDVMWDFPDNEKIQAIARVIYNDGGYLTSVYHGIAGLLNIKDENGKYLISGKKLQGSQLLRKELLARELLFLF